MGGKNEKAPDWCSAKRRQILDGARRAFTDLGFERASVDVIAARAGVSKATLYNHFQDKNRLFVACFAEGSDSLRAELREALSDPAEDIGSALQRAGEHLIKVFVSPGALALYRSAAEAFLLPEIGQMFFERGPRVTFELIASYLSRRAAEGGLRFEDPYAAAVQFVMLCHGDLVLRVHLGLLSDLPEEELRATVRRAVQTFLRAYRA